VLQRQKITDGSATAKALDYSLKRWAQLTQFLGDGQMPIDNNWIENQFRPIAIGRNNANCAIMRRPPSIPALAPSNKRRDLSITTSHNHSACKNASKAFGGRYRACLTSGAFNRARDRSFIARSASTYM
jgi:transposase